MCRAYTFVLLEFFKQRVLSYRRKYQHVEADFEQFLEAFDDRLRLTIPHCGDARKIRMASFDKGKGKSGSFRVIYFTKGRSTVPAVVGWVERQNPTIHRGLPMQHLLLGSLRLAQPTKP